MTVQYFILGFVAVLVLIDLIIWTQTYRKRLTEEDEEEEEECSHHPETFTSWNWDGGTTIGLFCDDCGEWTVRPFEDLPVYLQMKARKARQEQYYDDGEGWRGGDSDILLKD